MKLKIAIVGCGHICGQYGSQIKNYPDTLEIIGAMDLDPSRAEAFTKEYGGNVYKDFDAVLADPEVDIICNLTIHHVHFELNSKALKAGKHVYSEKPMALTYAQAVELCEIAKKYDRRIGAAPSTYMGEAIQTMSKMLETDLIGPLRLVYAEVNWAQIERWISNPAPYFTVGPLLDVGVYAITAMTYLLGPVKRVWGYSTILKNPRQDASGKDFPVTAPDFTTGMLEFASGVVARLTTNYYVPIKPMKHLKGLEFHGDDGAFQVDCYHNINAKCSYIPYAEQPINVPLLREPKAGMDRALGLVEMAEAIQENRPHRCSGEHAAHVIEIMEGLQTSSDESRKVDIHSTMPRSQRMKWAEQADLQMPEIPVAPEAEK